MRFPTRSLHLFSPKEINLRISQHPRKVQGRGDGKYFNESKACTVAFLNIRCRMREVYKLRGHLYISYIKKGKGTTWTHARCSHALAHLVSFEDTAEPFGNAPAGCCSVHAGPGKWRGSHDSAGRAAPWLVRAGCILGVMTCFGWVHI